MSTLKEDHDRLIHGGNLREWHRPANEDCPQNRDYRLDCTCKLQIKRSGKKKHKPRVIFRVVDHSVFGKIKPQLVAELHDDGKLIIRESKRRVSYETSLGKVYSRLVWNHAMQLASQSKRARREKSRSVKLARKIARRTR